MLVCKCQVHLQPHPRTRCPPRKERWVTYRYTQFFGGGAGNKLNSVWSGMCLRKRQTLLPSVGRQDAEGVLFEKNMQRFRALVETEALHLFGRK